MSGNSDVLSDIETCGSYGPVSQQREPIEAVGIFTVAMDGGLMDTFVYALEGSLDSVQIVNTSTVLITDVFGARFIIPIDKIYASSIRPLTQAMVEALQFQAFDCVVSEGAK